MEWGNSYYLEDVVHPNYELGYNPPRNIVGLKMIEPTQIQRSFDRDGFVSVESFLTQDEVGETVVELDRFIRDRVPGMPKEHVFYEDRADASTLKQLQQLHTYDVYFESLMIDSAAQALAETVLKEPVIPKNMQYFNKAPGVGKATPAHQDGYYFRLKPCNAVTLWLALDDVDEENGCVHYARGSHLEGLRAHGKTSTLGFSQGLVDSDQLAGSPTDIVCDARPGDLLAHHALTIHWAGENQSATRTRRALGFIYYAVSAEEDVEAKEAYQRTLQEELTQTNKI